MFAVVVLCCCFEVGGVFDGLTDYTVMLLIFIIEASGITCKTKMKYRTYICDRYRARLYIRRHTHIRYL